MAFSSKHREPGLSSPDEGRPPSLGLLVTTQVGETYECLISNCGVLDGRDQDSARSLHAAHREQPGEESAQAQD